jgi:hypothetical protein
MFNPILHNSKKSSQLLSLSNEDSGEGCLKQRLPFAVKEVFPTNLFCVLPFVLE